MNNPHDLLEKEGITNDQLSANGKEALKLFDEALAVSNRFLENDDLKKQAEQMGKEAVKVVQADIDKLQEQMKNDEEEKKKKEAKKKRSREVMEEINISASQADACRKTLREYNRQQREAGKTAAPKKKTVTTRLRGNLKSIINLIPKAKQKDLSTIQKTEKAINHFVSELKTIWGITKVQGIKKEIKEKIDELKEKAEKKQEVKKEAA
ncbi:MAG: hypothetical protein H6585_10000 [Flavobacteriales bacterium]|nr:hypothetical protein [Flavobacteriales bacterium]